MTELEVPSQAKHVYVHAINNGGDITTNVRAIATPVVVAELRRIATRERLGVMTPSELLDRADELEAGAR